MKKAEGKRPLKSGVRELLIFIERLFLVILSVTLALIFTNSFFQVSTPYGTTYHYGISPLEREKEFEEKEIFKSLLLGNMEQLVHYAAISHRLETAGEYDGKKEIDITQYAAVTQEGKEKLPAVTYYLDDLIAWGNYGFEHHTYKTGENKELMDYASSIEEYEVLKECLMLAAENLFENYSKYISFKEYCEGEKTNVKYYFKIPTETGELCYTNSKLEAGEKKTDDITALIGKESQRFIFFDPDKVQINTNTHISAKQLKGLFKGQEEVFAQGSKIWFWVEKDYPIADSFQTVKKQLEELQPYLQALEIVVFISALGGILSLFIVTKKEGRAFNEEGNIIYITKKSDSFPIEIWTLLVALAEGILLYLIFILLLQFKKGNLEPAIIPVFIGILAFTGNELGIRWYFSLIRRKKAGSFWSTTLLYLGGKRGREFITEAYENGSLLFRTWIPYLIFLMGNLILVLLGLGGVLGALLLDILIGVFLYQRKHQLEEIVEGIERITEGDSGYRIDTAHLKGDNLRLAIAVNSIGKGIRQAVETSMKDEKLKTDLITNVSHDIKTPLTSIITYVDLLKRENITNEKALGYLEILDNKSQRLKQLIDDLVEASKISSGNITLKREKINFAELVKQALAEFDEKLSQKQLQLICKIPQYAMMIEADSSQLWRVMENLISNACKYSLSGTRIYVEMETREETGNQKYQFLMKNISESFLEPESEELTERFMRGDLSRQTEGSGLGLSIAKNLVEAMEGSFKIEVDGDLFKAVVVFNAYEKISR
ncbi:MAG: HAMP domain-containing histidine kinase [Lachnospiraceae bacterium]|nr:HAMP domain-containing histidine kinase [Lachnospiraceae bacterium]